MRLGLELQSTANQRYARRPRPGSRDLELDLRRASTTMTHSAACVTEVCSSRSHFTGKERDSESGNDYFEARYFGSSMGRFMSPDWNEDPDPIPYANTNNPQTLNLYSYAGNNPLSRTDQDGHNYHVCDMNGGNCSDISDDQYAIWLKSNPNLSVTASGQIWGANPGGGSYNVGSASYYNENDQEGAAMIGFGGMNMVTAFAANMAGTVLSELGGAALGAGIEAFQASRAAGAGAKVLLSSGSKQAAKDIVEGLEEGAQKASARRAVAAATRSESVSITQGADGSITVSRTRPGFDGSQTFTKTIEPSGASKTVQTAVDSTGSQVHYDPKN